jgi:heterodisulfide reductase subunit C
LDLGFKFEIAKTREGRTVLGCIQCGICSSSCPFSEELDFKPHEMVKMILLGMREAALSSQKIWACATCYMCAERCPQKVELGNVLMAVANIAAREKGLPEQLTKIGGTLFDDGRVTPVTEGRQRERERLGLPPVPEVGISGMRRIVKEEGVAKLVGKEGT